MPIFSFLFSFLFLPFLVQSQTFAPLGAEWIYQIGRGCCNNGNEIDFVQWNVIKDTAVSQKNCRMIIKSGVSIEGFADTMFVYQDGQQVYFYDFYSQSFSLPYDFSKQKNESWVIKSGDCGLNVIVEEVSIIPMNQHFLKQLKVTSNNSDYDGYIVEKIGYLKKPQPDFSQYCHGSISYTYYDGLRCYDDSELGFYDSQIASSCEYVKVSKENPAHQEIKIHPNPSSGKWIVDHKKPVQNSRIAIFSSSGNKVQEMVIQNENPILVDLSNEPSGIYLLKWSYGDLFRVYKLQLAKN